MTDWFLISLCVFKNTLSGSKIVVSMSRTGTAAQITRSQGQICNSPERFILSLDYTHSFILFHNNQKTNFLSFGCCDLSPTTKVVCMLRFGLSPTTLVVGLRSQFWTLNDSWWWTKIPLFLLWNKKGIGRDWELGCWLLTRKRLCTSRIGVSRTIGSKYRWSWIMITSQIHTNVSLGRKTY